MFKNLGISSTGSRFFTRWRCYHIVVSIVCLAAIEVTWTNLLPRSECMRLRTHFLGVQPQHQLFLSLWFLLPCHSFTLFQLHYIHGYARTPAFHTQLTRLHRINRIINFRSGCRSAFVSGQLGKEISASRFNFTIKLAIVVCVVVVITLVVNSTL